MSPLWDSLRRKKRILVVDDDRDFVASISEVISSSIKGKNCQTFIAYDATGAIKSVKEHNPDLIILDVNLPDVNGFRLCRTLKDEMNYQGKILMLTIRSGEDDLRRGEGAGADGYIQKPVSNEELLKTLENLLATL